jgi:hypothetical protein
MNKKLNVFPSWAYMPRAWAGGSLCEPYEPGKPGNWLKLWRQLLHGNLCVAEGCENWRVCPHEGKLPNSPKTTYTVPQINPIKENCLTPLKPPKTTYTVPQINPIKENCLTLLKPPRTTYIVPQIKPHKGKLPNSPKTTYVHSAPNQPPQKKLPNSPKTT